MLSPPSLSILKTVQVPSHPHADISPLTRWNCFNRKRMRSCPSSPSWWEKKTPNSLRRDPSSLMLEAAAAPCWSRQEEVTPSDPLCGRGGLILTRGLSARWTAESYIKNSWQVQRVENSLKAKPTRRKTSIERSQHFFFFFFDKQNQSSRSAQRKPSGAAHIHPQWLISGTAPLYVGLRYPLYVFFFFFFSIVSPLGTQLSILQHCSDKCLDVVMEIWQFETISQAEQREGGELQRPWSFAAGAKVAGAFKGDKYHTWCVGAHMTVMSRLRKAKFIFNVMKHK